MTLVHGIAIESKNSFLQRLKILLLIPFQAFRYLLTGKAYIY